MRLQSRSPLGLGRALLGGRLPLICVPLVGSSFEAVNEELNSLDGLCPDMFELRMDAWDCASSVDETMTRLRAIRAATPDVALLLTCRHPSEGGLAAVPEAVRLEAYARAAREGLVSLVDLELASGGMLEAVRRALAGTRTKLVLSAHNFVRTPSREAMRATLEAELEAGADIVKLAVMPTREEDVLALLETALAFRRAHPDTPQIAIAMGELGMPSRLIGGHFGSDLTFAAGVNASAPGQMPLAVLRQCLAALYGTDTASSNLD